MHFSRRIVSSFLLSITAALIFSSCAKEKATLNVSLSANRRMGVAVRKVVTPSGGIATNLTPSLLHSWTDAALLKTFQPKIVPLSLSSNGLDDPDNLFEIGSKEIDDVFLLDITVPQNFVPAAMTSQMSESDLEKAFQEAVRSEAAAEDAIQVAGIIHNGANLKAVNVFRFVVPTSRPDLVEPFYHLAFKKSVMGAFANPNIYPRADAQYYANLLYVFSKQREKDYEDKLECENAVDVLKYYPKANVLYKLAISKGTSRAVGQQSEIQLLTSRHDESEARSKVLEECKVEQRAVFEVRFDYGTLGAEAISQIQKAYETAEMEDLLRKYTSKPVRFRFQIEANNDLSLFVDMRFDQARYTSWIQQLKVPSKMGAFQILSLDPYKAMMQKLVAFRGSLPKNAPAALKASFSAMKMTLTLKTLLKGEVTVPVDGRYFPEQKVVKMAYPNSVILNAPGFPSKTIAAKNDGIFQDKGWISLGNCKTLEGNLTEDGLLYRFFGFPCQ